MPVRTDISELISFTSSAPEKVHSGRIARISFSDPKANCFSLASLRALETELRALGLRDDIGVVGLESEGNGAFSAGASFDELKKLDSENAATDFFMGFGKVMLAIRDLPFFLVARVHGKAVGGSLGLLTAADWVCAAPDAEVRLSELSVGIGPFVVGPVLERKIGVGAFQQLTVDTGWKSAAWALDRGLYGKVAVSREALQSEYENELQRLASFSPAAVRAVKKMFWEGLPNLEALLQDRAGTVAKLLLESGVRFSRNHSSPAS